MKKLFIIFLVLILCIHLPEKNFGRNPFLTSNTPSDTFWIQHASMPYARYAAISFTINNKAYVGLGSLSNGIYANDFYEYDPQLDLWTNKADFPDDGRYMPTAFAINGKGYVCLGFDNSHVCRNDLWEYDPDSDSWTRKADFPGTGRYGACAFVIGGKAYVGTGSYNNGFDYLYDIWCYDPATNFWTSITNFPGGPRSQAVAFAIGTKGYLGSGNQDSYTPTKDFWSYDPGYGWQQIADLPGQGFYSCSSFVINGKGYVGLGGNEGQNYKEFWSYDPALNTWNFVEPLPSDCPARCGAVGFSINNIGYFATGSTNSGLLADLWSTCELPHCDFSFQVNDRSVLFTDLSIGAESWHWDFGDGNTSNLKNPINIYPGYQTYIVSLTVENSCGTSTHSDTVKLSCPPPVAKYFYRIDDPNVNFYDSSSSSTSWYWDFGDYYYSSLKNPVHAYEQFGKYYVCLTVTDSCGTDQYCDTVYFCHSPNTHFSFVNNVHFVTFTDSSYMATSWFWNFDDGFYSDLENPLHYFKDFGTYYVCLTSTNICAKETYCDSVVVGQNGISEVNPDDIVIYPIPASNKLYVDFGVFQQAAGEMFIMNSQGTVVSHQKIMKRSSHIPQEIDLENFPPGIYFIKMIWVNRVITKKFVVSK